MKSAVLNKDRKELIRLYRRMTPEERLKAYVKHCQVMDQVYQAGKISRSKPEAAEGKSKRTNT